MCGRRMLRAIIAGKQIPTSSQRLASERLAASRQTRPRRCTVASRGTSASFSSSILNGERDPEHLATDRDYRCHAWHAEIVAALTGNYRAEHLFALKQNFAAYEFLLQQIAECDREIEALLSHLASQQPPPATALPRARRKRSPKHAPACDSRRPLHRLTGGADLSQIDSIGPHAALQIVARNRNRYGPLAHGKTFYFVACVGTQQQDLGRTSAEFPDFSFGQSRRGDFAPLRDEPYAQLDCAGRLLSALSRTCGQGQGYHCYRAQLALLVYRTLSDNLLYHDPGAAAYQQLHRTRELKSLRRRALLLGFQLLDQTTGEVLNAVS